jgi:hypothetical protein
MFGLTVSCSSARLIYAYKRLPNLSMGTDCYREESERVSELKSLHGTSDLPAGALASGAEGIKAAIEGFSDA